MKRFAALLSILVSTLYITVSTPLWASPSVNWRFSSEKSYETESRGLAYSRRYVSEAGWIDVFVYDLGRNWQAGLQDIGFQRHFELPLEDVCTHARRGVYRDLEVGKPLDVVLLGQPFRAVKVKYALDGGLIHSSLYLTALRGKLLK